MTDKCWRLGVLWNQKNNAAAELIKRVAVYNTTKIVKLQFTIVDNYFCHNLTKKPRRKHWGPILTKFTFSQFMELDLGLLLIGFVFQFLADRTNGRAYDTELRLSVVCRRLQLFVLWLSGAS